MCHLDPGGHAGRGADARPRPGQKAPAQGRKRAGNTIFPSLRLVGTTFCCTAPEPGRTMAAAHKWGTSTKEGDSFPNVAVDIGFVGLDPANRKMCAGPLPCHALPCHHCPALAAAAPAPAAALAGPHPRTRPHPRPCPSPPPSRCPGRAISTRVRRRSGSRCRARSRPPDPRARSLASRKPRSRASLRRRGSTRCTSSPSTTAPS